MFRDGVYSLSFVTVLASGGADVQLQDGEIHGCTHRGTPLDGNYRLDPVRNMVRFEVTALMPPNFAAITGLRSGDSALPVTFRGEAPPDQDDMQFSIKFAGRMVDVTARYVGPINSPA
jgi:hypothetical protein